MHKRSIVPFKDSHLFSHACWFSHWAFGDGSTSTLTNPDHIFTTNNTFIVVLTVTDSTTGAFCFDYFIDTIVVTGVINPLQCTSGFVMYPDTVTNSINVFNSATGNNLSYLWDLQTHQRVEHQEWLENLDSMLNRP